MADSESWQGCRPGFQQEWLRAGTSIACVAARVDPSPTSVIVSRPRSAAPPQTWARDSPKRGPCAARGRACRRGRCQWRAVRPPRRHHRPPGRRHASTWRGLCAHVGVGVRGARMVARLAAPPRAGEGLFGMGVESSFTGELCVFVFAPPCALVSMVDILPAGG